jgi:hypothetical protein
VVIDLRRVRVLLLSAIVLFVLFFGLGHAMRSTHALPEIAAGPQTLPAQFTRAGIPYGLPAATAAAPIPSLATFRANPVVHHSHPSAPAPAPAATAPAESAPAASGPVVSAPATPAPSTPAPVTPAPVQKPAPVVSQPHSAPESGGGSFDTSE